MVARGVNLASSAGLVDALATASCRSLVGLPEYVRKDMLDELSNDLVSVYARIEDIREDTSNPITEFSFEVVFPQKGTGTVADMVQLLQAMIVHGASRGSRPVIVVDVANRFRNWTEADDSNLLALMDFFVWVRN